MNEAIYIVNWFRFVLWSLYEDYRKTTHVQWLYVTISRPIVTIHTMFLNYRIDALYRLNHNSQVASLEEVLNDKFDNQERRIFITTATILEPIWFYEEASQKPVYFYEDADGHPVYFYEEATISSATEDFTVHVPAALQTGNTITDQQFELLMKSYIDYYKLYSKSYTILYE